VRGKFLLKIVLSIVVFFGIGLLVGAFTRTIHVENDFEVRADVLDIDISDTSLPIDTNNHQGLNQPIQTIKETKETLPIDQEFSIKSENQEKPAAQIDCNFTMPEKPIFDARPIKNVLALKIQSGGFIKLALFFENAGNVPWFSANSKCPNVPVVNLGTTRAFDRPSIFYTQNGGWISNNRIVMQTSKVDPGQIGVFEFTIKTPDETDVYREFFGLVVEGKEWMKNSETMIDFYNNDVNYTPNDLRLLSSYLIRSGRFSDLDLNAEKSIEVDLSEQKMYLRLGDQLIRVFRISSGAPATPTPTGKFSIGFKQKVRIASGDIPYIMPKWQTVYNGVGIHALPILGNARLRAKIKELAPDEDVPVEWFKEDVLWTEAVNHIGTPVSHGCIRLLPEDADFAYEFTEEGTPVLIHT